MIAVAGVYVLIPERIHTAVAVDGGVSGELAHQCRYADDLRQEIELGIDYPHRVFELVHVRDIAHCGCIDLDVVGRDRRRDETDNALEDIYLGSGKPIGLNAFPLLADIKILVDLYGVFEVYLIVEVTAFLIRLPCRIELRRVAVPE